MSTWIAPLDRMQCACGGKAGHQLRFIVLTGGPGAGKTAVLEAAQRSFCRHVVVLPEAASIVFAGGFPRRATVPAQKAAQRAIAAVQRELERLTREEGGAALVLCDRGTLDSLAYWPGEPADYFADLATTSERELARYAAVIHLRTPTAALGYNHRNPMRTETAAEAAAIDARIAEVWSAHPRRHVIECSDEFVDKLAATLALIRAEVPPCCRSRPPMRREERQAS